jgi:hypothetical protein
VKVLLLDDAPPARGSFHSGDSGVFRCLRPVLVEERGFPPEPDAFLARFTNDGFHFDYFSPAPGGEPDVARIAELIRRERPRVVVGVLIRIETLVREAVERSGRAETAWECLHFPSHRSHTARVRFQDGLRGVIRDFAADPGRGPRS